DTLKSLKLMEDAQKRPLWLPSISGVAPAQILGMQYVVDQAIDKMEAGKKFIFCGDFDRFILRRVTYMTLKRLVERYAEYD
uniref:phage major capsid protein n=5 Tax=Enterobacterales TaxID=91347 RepID=UPI0013D6A059